MLQKEMNLLLQNMILKNRRLCKFVMLAYFKSNSKKSHGKQMIKLLLRTEFQCIAQWRHNVSHFTLLSKWRRSVGPIM
jgi:hypothetical protein